MPNLTWITKKYFPQTHPRLINSGNCYNWAYVAYQNYSNASLFTIENLGGHAFIKIGHRYFDAQHPVGVEHWAALDMVYSMCLGRKVLAPRIIPTQQNEEEFIDFWSKYGKYSIIKAA